jgi:tetratricopeptide (TPR) repeat protein
MWASYVGANAGTGMERAMARGAEAVALWRQSGDLTGLGEALVLHANVQAALGLLAEAEAAFEEARSLHAAFDDQWHRAVAVYASGRAAAMRGDLGRAERLQADSVAHFEAAGAIWASATVNADVAVLAERRGDIAGAIDRVAQARDAARQVGMGGEEAFLLGRLGNLWLAAGDSVQAEAYHDEALTLADELGFQPAAALALNGRAIARRTAGLLDEAEACASRARQVYRRSESAPGESLSLATLGFVAEARGDLDRARALHEEGLVVARRAGGLAAIALALEGLAGVAAAEGEGRRAARLLGHADRLRAAYGGAWAGPASDVPRITDTAAALLGAEAFAEAFRDGACADLDAVVA